MRMYEQFTLPLAEHIPIMPKNYMGKTENNGGFTKTDPRKWTPQEVEWLTDMLNKGFTSEQIAISMNRSETSINIKRKRLKKSNNTYNQKHLTDKYNTNAEFLEVVNPKTVLDLFSGKKPFYEGLNCISNDINQEFSATYHMDAFKCICMLYAEGKQFDLIDLDPFGSAYDCFDLAIKMAKKGLIITLGEIGHKRWRRLDYVSTHYGITTMNEFTTENLVSHIQLIGRRNKKLLTIWKLKEWQNISRVYFLIQPLKITEQWRTE